jgi:hypothetical protein
MANVEWHWATITSDSPPPAAASYIAAARSLLPGINALPAHDFSVHVAHAFLCSHALECVLKAYIVHVTGDEKTVSRWDIRHSLADLWRLAVQHGLDTEPEPPSWIMQLDFLHDRPFYLRYAPGLNAFAIQNPEPTRTELSLLLSRVVHHIESTAKPPKDDA